MSFNKNDLKKFNKSLSQKRNLNSNNTSKMSDLNNLSHICSNHLSDSSEGILVHKNINKKSSDLLIEKENKENIDSENDTLNQSKSYVSYNLNVSNHLNESNSNLNISNNNLKESNTSRKLNTSRLTQNINNNIDKQVNILQADNKRMNDTITQINNQNADMKLQKKSDITSLESTIKELEKQLKEIQIRNGSKADDLKNSTKNKNNEMNKIDSSINEYMLKNKEIDEEITKTHSIIDNRLQTIKIYDESYKSLEEMIKNKSIEVLEYKHSLERCAIYIQALEMTKL